MVRNGRAVYLFRSWERQFVTWDQFVMTVAIIFIVVVQLFGTCNFTTSTHGDDTYRCELTSALAMTFSWSGFYGLVMRQVRSDTLRTINGNILHEAH